MTSCLFKINIHSKHEHVTTASVCRRLASRLQKHQTVSAAKFDQKNIYVKMNVEVTRQELDEFAERAAWGLLQEMYLTSENDIISVEDCIAYDVVTSSEQSWQEGVQSFLLTEK